MKGAELTQSEASYSSWQIVEDVMVAGHSMEAEPPGEALRYLRSDSDGLSLSVGMFKVEPCRTSAVQLHQHELAGKAPQDSRNYVGVHSGDEHGNRIESKSLLGPSPL
jgi:hypothetical protein